MALPFFYISEFTPGQLQITLDEDTSRHMVQVLRMKAGEELHLTDGKGHLLRCSITEAKKNHCTVAVKEQHYRKPSRFKVSIAVSIVKNNNRFEWFLEKATEVGVTEIIPLLCERTEKERFRHDRMNAICISAMLQSQQVWLPVLHEPTSFPDVISNNNAAAKYIAHCDDGPKNPLAACEKKQDVLVLIGPEGDFTPAEIELALQHSFVPVSLGNTRLRTETAGVATAVLLCLV